MKKFFSFLLICIGLSLVFASCKDDEIALMLLDEGRGSELDGETTTPGALQRGEDGLWRATERVPLVGAGRVVDKISPALVAVAASQSGFNKIVDAENLNDYATLSGLSANLLGKEILSVRDIYRTYAGGQMVGFVIGNNEGGVLDLNLINLFVITLYNDGKLVGTYNVSTGGELLSLNLISIGNAGTQAMAVKVPGDVKFDEIMLSTTGVTADIEKMKIYYAFVGETDIEEVTTATYTESKVHDSDIPKIGVITNDNKAENLLKIEVENGCYLDYGAVLYKSKHYVDIDLGKTLPVGTEVGFTYEQGSVAGLTLGHTYSVTTYGSDGSEKDDFSSTNVLGVSVIGGGKGAYSLVATKEGTQRVRITSGPTFGLDVGAFRLLRAFTRKAVAIDPTSYFNIPEKITTPYTSYKFAKPEKGTLILSYTGSSTDNVTISDNVISGMTLGNTYSLNVTYIDVDGKSFVTPVQIECTENTSDNCNPKYLTKGDGWSVVNANETWGINVISVMTDTKNIVDGNNTTYASSATAINLLQHGVLAAVKNNKKVIVPAGETYRVGFIIQNASELLGASALKFFTIKLFNGNKEIESNVSLSSQGVSLGLLNGARDKMSISIETDQEFDGVALCTAGLLGVSLNNLRIYDAFYYEDATCGNSMAFDACSEMMNSVNCHLSINYDWTEITGVASVGASINDLANAVDVDANNYATITAPVGVASGFSIGFQFDEMKSGQWIGLKMRKPTGLTDVELLNGFKFEIMYKGQVVEEIKNESSGGVLGLNLLGYGEYVYLEATPKYNFDGIRISSGQLVGALKNYLIYGLYSMADADGNGIPDCSEGGEEGTTDVIYPDKYKYDICKSEPLIMDFTGGTTGKEYTFTFTEPSDNSEFGKVYITMPANRRVTITNSDINLSVGVYYLSITADQEEGVTQDYPSNIMVNVHPKTSAWKKDANSTDWNDLNNWTEGVPWKCTDVLIPSDCNYYPILKSSEDYYCNRIQFEPGAEVINTHYLNYEQAWVNVSLKSGEYNMFSAPLKETYTGDMFVSTFNGTDYNSGNDYEECWLDYTEKTYPANRFTPKVYQRLWNASVQNAQNDDGGYVAVNPEDNFWTAPFNLVSQEYKAGQGVLVRPDKEGEKTQQSYTFCFPKRHAKYEYYNYAETGAGSQTGRWETINRNSANIGRFIYEDDSRSVSFPYHVTLENKRPTTMFLAGNPFMAHINVKTFLEANPAVKKVKLINKNGNSYNYTEWDGSSTDKQIAPTQAFLVEVAEAYQSLYRYKLDIHFTEDMLELGK